MTRRELLLAGASAATLAGCARIARRLDDDLPPDLRIPGGDVRPAVRLLNRAGFGPRPGQLAAIEAHPLEAWVDQQLLADDSESTGLSLQLSRLEALRIDGMELRDIPESEILRQLSQAAILRATYSKWQLRERMVDFWTNHFNIYGRKGLAAYRKTTDDVDVIRRHALGTYPALLRASAHSAAMLAYLDNRQNIRGAANENYARELMELHTLGVHGGYTQQDVQEVARCFTGWTVEDRFLRHAGAFRFDDERHDHGPKTVLGHEIPGGRGIEDGEQVLTILVEHPACARFIATKLCRYFLGRNDSPWVEKLARIYSETGGDIPSMLKPLLLSEELLRGPGVVKRPFDFVVSALRALDATTDARQHLQRHLEAMGQPLFEWPMPDGYPDRTSAWTGSLLSRWNFAFSLVRGQIADTSVDLQRLQERLAGDAVAEFTALAMPGEGDARLRSAAQSHDAGTVAALALCSPEFQWR